MKRFGLYVLLAIVAAVVSWHEAAAQMLPRGPRTLVRAGLMDKPDSLKAQRDSLHWAALAADFEKEAAEIYREDSVFVHMHRTDDIHTLDSIAAVHYATGFDPADTVRHRVLKKGWLMNDSMGLSKVCWLSTVLPGYGQIYNKQYWKLPLLYGTVGAGITLFVRENKVYKPLKRSYDAYTNVTTNRSPELNALQSKMIRSNTKRQLYLGLTIASYAYFIGDAAVNYSTNKVSDVKKATTLACIFPGAGQIYNKSYWKVPFVVGGFGSMIYCIDWNNRGYQRFKKAYSLRTDYDANPDKYPNGSPDEFRGRYTPEFLKNLRNNFRRNRDLCLIISGALYVLQIVDAHVDAHLKDYDISDDLTMTLEPLVDYDFNPVAGNNSPYFGFNMSLKF